MRHALTATVWRPLVEWDAPPHVRFRRCGRLPVPSPNDRISIRALRFAKRLPAFVMEIRIGYPSPEQEEEIAMKTAGITPTLSEAAFDRETFLKLRDLVLSVPLPKHVAAYAVRLCGGSRPAEETALKYVKNYVTWGAGPRGSQNLVLAAKSGVPAFVSR